MGWGGAGSLQSATPWPTAQRTDFDGNRHNPSALRRRHGAGAVGAPGWLSLPHGWAAVPSQRHTVGRGRAPLLSTRPQGVHPPPMPGGEQAADPPEGTGRAWAGAGRWCRGGRWLFLMSSDDGPCLSPQAEGHSRRAGLQGAGGRLGARHTVHGCTGVAGPRASAESRSALRRPGEAEAAASGLRVRAAGVERGGGCGPTRPLLTPRHPALPLLGSRCLRRGRGVILTLPPPDCTSAAGCSSRC